MTDNESNALGSVFSGFAEVVSTLRRPNGCPWDREQTPRSMRAHLIEEAYETVEAIDEGDPDHVREELGDVLLVLGMVAQMYSETGSFSIGDVLRDLTAKLVRRHPHVFGDAEASSAEEGLKNWQRIKTDIEGRSTSAIDGVSGSLPPLARACKLQKNVAKDGFDWIDSQGPKEKILEELAEIERTDDVEDEIGDLLFSVVNYARHRSVDPVLALRRTNAKFERRYRHVEESMTRDGAPMAPENIAVMEHYWNSAKIDER